MDPETLAKATSLGMRLKKGYGKLNEGNLEPRITAAADKTAESFDELISDHFYGAIKSEEMNIFTEEFKLENDQSVTEKFADVLSEQLSHMDIDEDFEKASETFFENLEREIAKNDEVLFRQLKLYKLDLVIKIIKEQLGENADPLSPDYIYNLVEPVDSIFRYFTSEIDNELLQPVRELSDIRRAEEAFETRIRKNIQEATGLEFEEFQDLLKSDDLIFVNEESIEEDLLIHISDGFNELEFAIPPGHLNQRLTIENPDLLWDCPCMFSNSQNCKIHSKKLGREISKRFGQGFVKIAYRDTEVLWKDSQYFWPPSVDTIYMIENILEEGFHNTSTESICEIGCGTSLMGILLASMNEAADQLYVTDWLMTPLLFSRINWELNKNRCSDISFTPILGYGSYWIGESPAREFTIDHVYCNPPYLPDLGDFASVQEQHTVGGTALLELLIADGDEFADEVFINFSEIALPEAQRAEKESAASLEQIGSTHTVPFRVPSALGDRHYMEHLIDERNVKIREDSKYPFWHDIATYRLRFE